MLFQRLRGFQQSCNRNGNIFFPQLGKSGAHVYFQMNIITHPTSKKDAWGWCTGTTQRDGMGREEGSGWGARVCLWRIHFDIWQNQYNTVKFKNKIKLNKKKKKESPASHLLFISQVAPPTKCHTGSYGQWSLGGGLARNILHHLSQKGSQTWHSRKLTSEKVSLLRVPWQLSCCLQIAR